MKLPFIKDNTKNIEQKRFHKVIQNEVWKVTKLFMSHKLTEKDIDKLDKLYENYHKKFPDIKGEQHANKRIAQLRGLIK